MTARSVGGQHMWIWSCLVNLFESWHRASTSQAHGAIRLCSRVCCLDEGDQFDLNGNNKNQMSLWGSEHSPENVWSLGLYVPSVVSPNTSPRASLGPDFPPPIMGSRFSRASPMAWSEYTSGSARYSVRWLLRQYDTAMRTPTLRSSTRIKQAHTSARSTSALACRPGAQRACA